MPSTDHRRDPRTAGDDALQQVLSEQLAYYRAIAPTYEQNARPGWHGEEIELALERFRPAGRVLEMACGTGSWTQRLLRHADSVTALDAAPEMLAIAGARVRDQRAQFVQADLFSWQPEGTYDVVFFGFWLSHVPPARFERFWELVMRCLRPGGRVFFVDDGHRAPDELVEGRRGVTVRRRLNDGSTHRLVKVPLEPAELERRLRSLGWDMQVTRAPGAFFWGSGRREESLAPGAAAGR